jgi:hypothetical protein
MMTSTADTRGWGFLFVASRGPWKGPVGGELKCKAGSIAQWGDASGLFIWRGRSTWNGRTPSVAFMSMAQVYANFFWPAISQMGNQLRGWVIEARR